ncbi:MAG: peptidoglycan bridge formation glycyltransferase FemA/FemB family protein [Chloroflexota bacterium]|nr:peptidoglycan bridge formation glycyltransferase FemA/FemB family protein [Chloroflexota bacterium]
MLKNWNEIIALLPNTHVLQSREWAAVKARHGWQAIPVVWVEVDGGIETRLREQVAEIKQEPLAAALLLRREISLGASVAYVPKGPLLNDWGNANLRARVLQDLAKIARSAGAIFIKIDPDVVLGTGVPGKSDAEESSLGTQIREEWKALGWHFSDEQVQYRNTVLVDLSTSEDDILMRMNSKTRYNIRLAGRKGVKVRVGDRDDLDMLYKMYAETSVRGGFTIREQDYYQAVWEEFLPSGVETGSKPVPIAEPLIAEVDGEAVAGAVIFRFGKQAWYLHGMSTLEHREKMSPHLIQWEAMRWAKEAGCTVYDMWGAPDVFEKSDSMWGVYRFKRGFGGTISRTIGAWDLPLRPGLYKLYNSILPKVLDMMRRFGDKRTKEAAS